MSGRRFSRHRELVTDEGLNHLQAVTVAVCGAGGLGSTVLSLLARCGVGSIRVYDDARVDEPDLNRQTLYTATDIGALKAERAAALLEELGDNIRVVSFAERIDARTDFAGCDLVVDCLDNFATRFLVDAAVYDRDITFVHAGVYRYFGQVTSVHRSQTRSLRDLFVGSVDELDNEKEKPMFPPAVVTVAALEASECILQLLPEELRPAGSTTLFGKLLSVDLNTYEITTIPFV
ncbi:MAG: HesA/MoeB/ThiF family protein [Spirochaetota bacterium]